MEVSAEVHKVIKCTIYITVFLFTSGGGVDDLLVRLLIKQKLIIQCQTSTGISRIVNEFIMSRTIFNMYTYPFNPQLLIKTYVESHDKKAKDQRNFHMWTFIF